MRAGIDIARIAALVSEPARAEMLLALMSGQALTATELARLGQVSKQTASSHLARMLDARLLAVESQGRHRYFRLADDDVAQLLEHLLGLASRVGATVTRSGPRDAGLRKARICYDHLAGELGVLMFDSLLAQGSLKSSEGRLHITPAGEGHLRALGLNPDTLNAQRRLPCRSCLDWSMRRHHLAGALGAALLADILDRGWARRARESRAITFTIEGERRFRRQFKL